MDVDRYTVCMGVWTYMYGCMDIDFSFNKPELLLYLALSSLLLHRTRKEDLEVFRPT